MAYLPFLPFDKKHQSSLDASPFNIFAEDAGEHAPSSKEPLSILDEAIAVFDASGKIVLSNAAMRSLLGIPSSSDSLRGQNIRDVFFSGELERVSDDRLPFATNGSSSLVMALLYDGSLAPVVVRCQRLGLSDEDAAKSETYLVVAGDVKSVHGDKSSQMRLLDELRRSNERLRGVLSIISTSTLEIDSFDEFMNRVTSQLKGVFDADAVLLYLAEGQGFRLASASEGYERLGVDQTYIPQGYGITSLVTRTRRSMRLRLVSPPRGNEGAVMVDLDNDMRIRLQSPLVRRVSTLVATPVFSYDRVMSVILVCWTVPTAIDSSALPLLDTVADYLSMEFATAVSQFQQTRRLELSQMVDDIRELVHDRESLNDSLALSISRDIVAMIPAHPILLWDNPWTGVVTARSLDEDFLRADPQLPRGEGEEDGVSSAQGNTRTGNTHREDATQGNAQQTDAVQAGVSSGDGDATSEDGAASPSSSTAIMVAYREGIGFPLTFDEIFPNDEMFRLIRSEDPIGVWAGRHTDLASGIAVRLSSPSTAGETPQYALLLMRGRLDPPFDELETEYARKIGKMLHRTLDDERERVADTHIAQTLQSGLRNELPDAPGLTTESLYLSATASAVVGGDFFDLYTLPDNRVVVVIGDVSGKGVEAAAMASLVKTALAAYAWDGLGPAEIASSVNSMVVNFSRAETFASLLIMRIDVGRQSVTYCSAGHPPAMLVRHPREDHAELELLSVQSPVIGAMADMDYEDGSFSYDVGDVMFLYTDGTTEARSPKGDFFGEDQLRECVLRASRIDIHHMPEAILGEVANFSQGNLHDDIAMVALRFDKPPASAGPLVKSPSA
jgi:sigma-B regulation protein RsbU (phosphoserine phosphatase)